MSARLWCSLMAPRLAPTLTFALRLAPRFVLTFVLTFALTLFGAANANAQATPTSHLRPWSDLGRAPTVAEIKAWDIDVRPDFKGLPLGSGSVAKGQEVWETRCESCHGAFGESNEFFTPIVGGTTADDIKTGRVASLRRNDVPQRSTLMKVANLSTLWDYINRAMPWNAPKSLSVEEVYAVTAFILYLGDIVPADFVLHHGNMREVQARMPNRNGMVRQAAMWQGRGKPDVQGDACMRNCAGSDEIRSLLPDYARDSHGNLADQQRLIGPVRGAVTARATAVNAKAANVTNVTNVTKANNVNDFNDQRVQASAATLAKSANCTACHHASNRMIGPSFKEIADRYSAQAASSAHLAERIRHGGQGVWGQAPMPAHPNLDEDEISRLVRWILAGAL
jgi:S-disulfanyl-L-cysteine oxidoreductase SoxD